MTPSRRAGCGCLLAVVVCLHAIVSLALLGQRSAPPAPAPSPSARPRRAPPPPGPRPDPDRYRERVPKLGVFRRADEGDRLRLSFGFVDHHGRAHDVSCSVAKRDDERERAWFGYDDRELDALIDDALTRHVAEELERRGLAPHVSIRFHDGGSYEWTSRFEGVADQERLARLMAAREEWRRWMKTALPGEHERIQASLYKAHGFLLQDRKISIDYEQVALRSTPVLQECFRALQGAAAASSARQRLGLYLALFQELRYELPPKRVGRRETHGFWVPTEVLVEGRGDCDSKAAAFCALWRNLPHRVLLVVVPGHALVAVEGKPGANEHFVRLGNRYFVLCEVAGPAKTHPGRKPLSGQFRYVAMPRVSESGADADGL